MTSALHRQNNIVQRVIVAIIGAFIIITGCILSVWGYFIVFFFVTMFTILEFYKLVGIDGMTTLKFWGTFLGLLIYSLTFLVQMNILPYQSYFVIAPIASITFFIKLYKKEEKPFTNIAFTFLGVLYVAIPFSLINISVFHSNSYEYEIIIGMLLILWASDTGAYFAGTKFGKTKLFKSVSPKKSWEGSIGGTITAFIMAFVISYYFDALPQWEWLSIAAIMVIIGTYGDLVESLFKRSLEIKDSGKSIPGHGGFLDRFDGLLLASPFIVAFLRIM